MTAPRIRDVKDTDELARIIDDFMTQGYNIKEQGSESALLKKNTWGSGAGWIVSLVLAFILCIPTLFLSFLIPIVYGIYAHYSAPEILIRVAYG